MNQRLHRWLKSLLVGVCAVALTAVGIQASDIMSSVSNQFAATVVGDKSVCGPGAELILFGTHSICMDKYEASPGEGCTFLLPQGEVETQVNVLKDSCFVESTPGKTPWRFVTYTEASQLCARSGKRLVSANEWYKVALGQTNVDSCLTGQLALTGANECITPTEVHDMIGNVWEWTANTVVDGRYEEVKLPESGYITLVGEDGVVLETSTEPNLLHGKDYAWIDRVGVRGMLRGGFYGSGEDGGIFSQNISVPLDFSGAGVGFRCARDVR